MDIQYDQESTVQARLARHADFIIVGILFVFYLFFANYYAWGLTFVNGGGISTLPTSGGSDPYYNFYLILHFLSTGHWLVHDPSLNYPFGSTNPRNPFFHVMLVFVAEVLAPIFGAKMAAFYAFEEFDAVFGALLIIPVYLITKEIFGKKAGYLAAFLYTLMPSNLSAGILSGGRMHTPELIFAFFTVYFFAMAMKYTKKNSIIDGLHDIRKLPSRLREFYYQNTLATVYALLAGASLGGLMLAWQGYAYIEAIILIYVAIQLIANLILKKPTGYITFYTALFIILGFAMGAYYYQAIGEGPAWYNAELLIGILIILFSGVINIIGRRPWVLIIPLLLVVAGGGVLGLNYLAPSLLHRLLSGDGYFIKTRVYDTIAEAQAPALGQYISGFGVAQFILGIAGLIYIVYLYIKERKEEILFVLVFSLVSIYMSFAAARFNITAAPAYGILGAAILMYFARMVKIDDLKNRKNVGYGSIRKAIKGNIKWVQAAFVVIIALVLLVPSALSMVSASVPANTASQINTELTNAIPAFLKVNKTSTVSFAGALGVPIDNASQPLALSFSWLATQNSNLPISEKPAYVSWWDYGFQELYQGQHPTVADDFQQGIPQAGEILLAQNQSQDIALFIAIDLQANYQQNGNHFSPNVENSIISELGTKEYRTIVNVSANPGDFTSTVLNNPSIYGQYVSSITSSNVYYAFLKGNLSYEYPTSTLVNLYQNLIQETGYQISYIQIDHNLFPSSATSPGIFYAPAYLTYTPSYASSGGEIIPTEYYNVYGITDNGTFPLNQLNSSAVVLNYTIQYTPQFYNSSIYRFTIGYPPTAVGQTNGIPGVSFGQTTDTVMPAWNMSHFEVVYENSLYNPYKNYQAHPTDFKEIPLQEAYKLQKENNGTVVLFSSASQMLTYSDPIVEYFPGAIVQGKVTTPDGTPVPGVRVTIFDQYGIPHQTVVTNDNGEYTLSAVPGNDTLIFSTGSLNQEYLIGSNSVGQKTINVTNAQAERITTGYNTTTGLPSYYITENLQVSSSSVSGSAQYSFQQNPAISSPSSANTVTIRSGNVILTNSTYGLKYNLSINNGNWSMKDVPPLSYEASLYTDGHMFSDLQQVNVTVGGNLAYNIKVPFDVVFARIMVAGSPVSGVSMSAFAQNGTVWDYVSSNSSGVARIYVTPGTYSVRAAGAYLSSYPQTISFSSWNENRSLNVTPDPSAQLSVYVTNPGSSLNGTLYHDGAVSSALALNDNGNGMLTATVPLGTYTVYLTSGNKSFMETVQVNSNMSLTATLESSSMVSVTSHIHGISSYSGTYEILSSSGFLQKAYSSGNSWKIMVPSGYYSVSGIGTYTGGTLYGLTQVVTPSSVNVNLSLQYNDTVSVLPFISTGSATGYSTSSSLFSGIVVLRYDNNPIYYSELSTTGYSQLYFPSYASGLTFVNYSGAFFQNQSYRVSAGTQNLPLVPKTLSFSVAVSGSNYKVDGSELSLIGNNGAFNYTVVTGNNPVEIQPGLYAVSIHKSGETIVADRSVISVVNGMVPDVTINSSAYSSVNVSGSRTAYLYNSSGSQYSNLSMIYNGQYTLYAFNSTRGVAVSQVNITGDTTLNPSYGSFIYANLSNSLQQSGGTYYVAGSSFNISFQQGRVALPSGSYTVTYEDRVANSSGSFIINGSFSTYLGSSSNLIVPVSQHNLLATLEGYVTYGSSASSYATVMLLNSTGSLAYKTHANYLGYYSLSVSTGQYTLYVLNNATSTGFFGSLSIPGFTKSYDENVTMLPAYKELISVNLGASIIYHTVTASVGNAVFSFNSSVGSITLPIGNYTFSSSLSSTTMASNGTSISVSYSQSETLYINSAQSIQITLQLVVYHAFSLKLDTPVQAIKPGSSETGNVTITNQGNSVVNVTLSSGSSKWTVKFNQTSFILQPGQHMNLTFNATLTGNVEYGSQQIPVIISYAGGSTSSSIPVKILQSPGYSIKQNLTPFTKNSDIYLPVAVNNTGNAPISVNLSVNDTVLKNYGWVGTISYNNTTVSSVTGQMTWANITVGFNSSKVIYVVLSPNASAPIKSFSFTLYSSAAGISQNITMGVSSPTLSSISPYPVGPGVIGNYTGDPYESLIIGLVIIAVAVVAGIGIAGYRGRKK